MGLTGGDDLEVVGESRYQSGIRRLVDMQRHGGQDLYGLLVAEPLNPFDHHAVRVDLLLDREREIAGYLSREQAYLFQDLIKSAMDVGALPILQARAYGGTTGKPNIGVWLSHFERGSAVDVTEGMIKRSSERRATRDRLNEK